MTSFVQSVSTPIQHADAQTRVFVERAIDPMKQPRRLAWIVFVVALLLIIAVGFFRASMHDEARPASGPAPSASIAR
ncbi:MAG: hypothetical protein AB1832_02590 [Pseudomonadota bacterium]